MKLELQVCNFRFGEENTECHNEITEFVIQSVKTKVWMSYA